ncbi:MAG TPA: hypothetical protein PKZ07_15170 [Sedimentisphaerales bacterium]|nr:hypothetical protein [Sedimentisphaerales bacterium]
MADRVELSPREGVILLDGVVAGVEPSDGWLVCDWISRLREAIRSTMDCPPSEFCSGTLGNGLERNEVVGRLELIDGPERSTDGLGWLGLTEILGDAELTDGADRSIEGLGRLIDGLDLLGLTDGIGATGAGRLPAIRSRRPPPARFD